MKLTNAQQRVLDKMYNGWELGQSTGINQRWWLQKDGLGRGGEVIEVNAITARWLWDKGFIKPCEWSFPTQHFRLEGGK